MESLFAKPELSRIRSKFLHVASDFSGEKRLFFDNAGGSLRLARAEQAFAPYKFFGVRGFAVAYVSDRCASFMHHRLLAKAADDWSLGSPAPRPPLNPRRHRPDGRLAA